MTTMIETDDDYKRAIEQMNRLSAGELDEADRDAFLALTAAMLAYETRSHPALTPEPGSGGANPVTV